MGRQCVGSVGTVGTVTNGNPMWGTKEENNMPHSNKDLPEALPLSGNVEIDHRINPAVNRNTHPLVGPLEGVGVECFVVSGTFLALPAKELCHNCAQRAVIERRANVVHTLRLVADVVPPGLHNLVTCMGKMDYQDE